MHEKSNTLNQESLESLLADEKLNNVVLPHYNRRDVGVGIVHLGLGAFHRSHQAMFTEQLFNKEGASDWGICGVSFRNEHLQAQLLPQDCLYTSATLDSADSFQVVGALKEVLVVKTQLAQVLARMAASTTKIVSLTVTEKGYSLTADGLLDESLPDVVHDLANIDTPKSAIGLLVAACQLRFNADIKSFNVIACDNLPHNGEKLKSAVLQFAEKISLPLASWINANAEFPNTMVDCITPQTEQATIDLIENTLGLLDTAPVQREHFSQWVIQDCDFERPAWEKVGVIFTNDVADFENAKLRILNGLHSALAYIGVLRGHDTVYEAISDPVIKPFLINLLDHEIIPTLAPVKGLDIVKYSREIITRFENPKIKHLLRQIGCDGSIKIPVRTLAPLADNLANNRSIESLCVVVAAWLRFIGKSVKDGIEINDPRASDFLKAIDSNDTTSEFKVKDFLNISGLIPETLRANNAFMMNIEKAYASNNALFTV